MDEDDDHSCSDSEMNSSEMDVNGVPLPSPPPEVMALRKNCEDPVFLVLFFDAKRTWQWLPADKLELLGLDKELDQGKLIESRKPTERKAVSKAYQEALHYQSQVSSASGPAGKLWIYRLADSGYIYI